MDETRIPGPTKRMTGPRPPIGPAGVHAGSAYGPQVSIQRDRIPAKGNGEVTFAPLLVR